MTKDADMLLYKADARGRGQEI